MITKALFNKFHNYVAINDQLIGDFINLGVKPGQISYIPNGVDTSVFCPPTRAERKYLRSLLGIPERARVIVFSGRLVKDKGIDTLMEAFKSVNNKFPETFLLVIGGANPDPAKVTADTMLADFKNKAWATSLEEAEQKAKNMGVCNVKFTWSVLNVADYLKTGDIFVFPSNYKEGLSNSLLEGMSVGLPVVASGVSSVAVVITNGVNGLFFEVGNADDLTSKLVQLISNSELRTKIGKNARKLIVRNFSIESAVDSYAALFTS